MSDMLLSKVANRLAALTDTPALDAAVLLSHVLDKPRTWVMAHPELALTDGHQRELDRSLARLERGEPLPYVLGHWEFFGLTFEVTPAVLIPRPETELLVERAIAWLQRSPRRSYAADIGTGSGAIAVALAHNLPAIRILATDIAREALQVAKRNAGRHRVSTQIDFIASDLLPAQPGTAGTLDLICANLPYIPSETLRNLPIYGREPTLALDGGPDGLDLYRRLFALAPAWLAPDGKILIEFEATQGAAILSLARVHFPQATIELQKDLAGMDRVLEVTLG